MACRVLFRRSSWPNLLPFLLSSRDAISTGPPPSQFWGDQYVRDKVGSDHKNLHQNPLEKYCVKVSEDVTTVSINDILKDIGEAGLKKDDPCLSSLIKLQEQATSGTITLKEFFDVASPNMALIEKVLRRELIIPEFANFTARIDDLYKECVNIREGKTADYIPQLKNMNPDLWGVSLCTINGQKHSIGDFSSNFTMQSGVKCFTYAIAVEEYGADFIHRHVGKEPSGQSFNSLSLNSEFKPHNPMINAGALVFSSLIKPNNQLTERIDFMMQKLCEIAGLPYGSIKCDILTCDSEMATANRNYALLHYMKDMKVLSPGVDIKETLRFYTRLCSLEIDCQKGAVMAATLANSGVCPITGTKVFGPSTVCNTLSLMHSCGMYDSAGEFTFTVGLPAKSGVSGVIIVVVPNVMGLCLYSPLVNKNGNSLRGLNFCQRLVETFNFHSYDSPTSYEKIDPRIRRNYTSLPS